MDYEVKPFQGVGDIAFGMTRLQVRERIGGRFKSFKRSPSSVSPCDYFSEMGIFAYYNASSELAALEFALPANPEIDGVKLLQVSFGTASDYMKTKDTALEFDNGTVIAHKLGISLYAPESQENRAARCESVLAFATGYYS